VCSTFTFGSQAAHWVANGQCDCIYYHNTYGWDFPVVGALIAPRPLLILSGQKDSIFPPDGYHLAYQKAKEVYDLYAGGDSDRIRELDDNVEHSDPPLFLSEARQWMQRWLKDDPTPLPIETNAPPKEKSEDLACLDRIPADAINCQVQNQFVTAAAKMVNSRAAWQKRRGDLMAQLKEKVFRWFPTTPAAFETKLSKSTGGWVVRYGYSDYQEGSFQSEQGVRVRVQIYTPKKAVLDAPVLIYVRRSVDSFYSADFDELLPLMGRSTVIVLNPRFTEQSMGPGEFTDVERTAVWVGRTTAAMQVWDILRAVKWAVEDLKLSPASISLCGKGEMGILALYAALFDERIKQVILNAPPTSHWQGPALLNVLRVTDIPEAAGALAPRRLISLTPLPEAFDYTKRIYRMQRASQEFVQSGSLPEALGVWKR